MEITYLNHSSFLIKTKYSGNQITKILIDPFSPDIGIKYPKQEADIVLMSHQHSDHNYVEGVKGLSEDSVLNETTGSLKNGPFVIKTAGEYELRGIYIKGIQSFHDDKKGELRGPNVIYTVSNENLTVCHLGDLGHILSESQVEAIGPIDVLLVPVGGFYTIDPETAVNVISQIEPGFVIPMHYKSSKHNEETFGKLSTLADFIKEMGIDDAKKMDSFKVEQGNIEETEVIVLNPVL
jgi:L-ascorbate metabolism protein UlaG (beta-lactamase superfamily)